MNTTTKYVFFGLAFVGLSSLFMFATKGEESNETDKSLLVSCETKLTPRPKSIKFLDESVPLHITDVKERLDRELLVNTYWHSNTILLMKRANKYFPIIEPILKKNGVPDDFKYLATIESGLDNVVSPAGARGFWQIMPRTAKELNLEITKTVDERYNLELATEAACKYLLKSKEELGSWALVAASYNVGLSAVKRRMEEQHVNSYFDLYLPTETARYVFRIIAIKEIMENPLKYGFAIEKDELFQYEPTKNITVDTTITNLALFAKTHGINYKLLKLHNPWLRDKYLEDKSGKLYTIKIPLQGN